MEMIRVENVNLKIEKNTILNNVTMQVNKGEIVALIGRNGSGKTMLMKCICGFVKTTSGSIFVNEKKVGKEIDFPEKMGVIIETPGFISQYSGMKNLWLLAKLNSTLTKNEIASNHKFFIPL